MQGDPWLGRRPLPWGLRWLAYLRSVGSLSASNCVLLCWGLRGTAPYPLTPLSLNPKNVKADFNIPKNVVVTRPNSQVHVSCAQVLFRIVVHVPAGWSFATLDCWLRLFAGCLLSSLSSLRFPFVDSLVSPCLGGRYGPWSDWPGIATRDLARPPGDSHRPQLRRDMRIGCSASAPRAAFSFRALAVLFTPI